MVTQPDSFPAVLSIESQHDFNTTIERLKAALLSGGATVFADIDQRDAALGVGLDLRRTRLILFGNPKAGTPIMVAHPHAALELPLHVVVWEGDDGDVTLDYRDVIQTLGSYGVAPGLYAPLQKIPEMLRAVAG